MEFFYYKDMFTSQFAFYLGKEKEDGYSGVVVLKNLFLIIEIYEGLEKEKGVLLNEYVKNKINYLEEFSSIEKLADFEDFVNQIIQENNLPTGFSLACGYLKDDIFYLKTINLGKIFIRRKNKFGLLLEGNKSASGFIENNDFFVFTTENFFDLIDGEKGMEKIFDHKNPYQIVDSITPDLKMKNDLGAVALFVNFLKIEEKEDEKEIKEEKNEFLEKVKNTWFLMKSSKKIYTFFTALFLFVIFIWSVVLSYNRRLISLVDKNYEQTKNIIKNKLTLAEDVAYLNIDTALVLLKESKKELEKMEERLKNIRSSYKQKKIKELADEIKLKEDKIFKKKEMKFAEFFDLALEDKESLIVNSYLMEDHLFLLDNKNGVLYDLSLTKKSLNKWKNYLLKNTLKVVADQKNKYLLTKEGVYLLEDNEKTKKIIEKTEKWGKVIDGFSFNNNLYLLDQEKDEVFKYIKTNDGFTSPISYFEKQEAVNLEKASSLAIDGAVYIAGDNLFLKYLAGVRESFKLNLPDDQVAFQKVFTNDKENKIYLWEKKQGKIYLLQKTGEYLEQLNNPLLKKANDLVVYQEKVYLIVGNKIFVQE